MGCTSEEGQYTRDPGDQSPTRLASLHKNRSDNMTKAKRCGWRIFDPVLPTSCGNSGAGVLRGSLFDGHSTPPLEEKRYCMLLGRDRVLEFTIFLWKSTP